MRRLIVATAAGVKRSPAKPPTSTPQVFSLAHWLEERKTLVVTGKN